MKEASKDRKRKNKHKSTFHWKLFLDFVPSTDFERFFNEFWIMS